MENKMGFYLKKISNKLKGLFKAPFFYLLVVLIVFLFGILVFSSKSALKSPALGDLSFLTADATAQNLFAKAVKNFIRESPEMVFVQKNSLVGISSPVVITPQVLGSLLGSVELETETRKEIVEYIVESGDTLSSIVEKFDVSLNTILWANDLSKNSIIKPGQKLIILPVLGVIYHVKRGDTLSEIAKTYKGEVEEIIAFNGLSSEGDIFIGDILIIPDGTMPSLPAPSYYAQIPLGSSYFICPHSAYKISQGLHWYNAVDFSGKCGDPIYAAAAGKVLRVSYGWNGGAGNYITILHPNGVVTMYGHIFTNLVSSGQEVSQGDIIALMGGKPGTPGAGLSTGCHVHFDVRGARNPFAK